VGNGVRLVLVFWGLGLFCIKELCSFDVFARNASAETEIWADLGERVWREKSKGKRQSAKLRKPDVVGLAVFIAARGQPGRETRDGGIGFELGLFFGVPGRR